MFCNIATIKMKYIKKNFKFEFFVKEVINFLFLNFFKNFLLTFFAIYYIYFSALWEEKKMKEECEIFISNVDDPNIHGIEVKLISSIIAVGGELKIAIPRNKIGVLTGGESKKIINGRFRILFSVKFSFGKKSHIVNVPIEYLKAVSEKGS